MIKLYLNEEEIKEAAKLSVNYHLYFSGWLLHDRLESLYDGFNYPYAKCHGIALYFNGGIPIGICIVWKHLDGTYESNFYVSEMYRRQGIAKHLFAAIYETIPDKKTIRFYKGNSASEYLFDNLMKEYRNTHYRKKCEEW